ncbi:MAG: Stp1/IreP family PP2C-type Ser/Thr phosphatase [Candidatus Dadabacteria bacterium]|nr:Stp1/IreP family PP2C-type Ser/Thr phosphatase [Candidatus Dadabacteria bacterium]NIQ14844.1 Stp1/IreP family PP2C-type Ser/Thr phosphatase [Candidatus Dadabacteria bacterium]
MNFITYSLSDIGKIRERNEDSFLEKTITSQYEKKGVLLVVADGMGGHKAGDVASKTLVSIFDNCSNQAEQTNYQSFLEDLILQANQKIIDLANSNLDYNGMGTTCTAMVIADDKSYIGHVGDSRAYLVRKNEVKQLTKDHTVAEQMHQMGMITKEQAINSPRRNMLLKAVGIHHDLEVDILEPISILNEDIFILCSDGLIEYVDEDEIMSLATLYEPQKACEIMVSTANKRGGKDNITVQITKINNKTNNNKINGIFSYIKKIIKSSRS